MHEQMVRIGGRRNELAVVFVEGPSIVVSRMNEQSPNTNVVRDSDSSTNRVD